MMRSMGVIPILFLSTLSARRATDTSSLLKCQVKFLSTLSARRATGPWLARLAPCAHFYPRSPQGERRYPAILGRVEVVISIHALRKESDSKSAQNSGALLRI